MSAETIQPALSALLRRAGLPDAIDTLTRLSGGANLESWYFAAAGQGYVLRRAPSADWVKERPMGLATEAATIRRAHAAGVAAPEIVVELEPGDELGIGFVMRALPGTAAPTTVLGEAKPEMITDLARELAAIHRVDFTDLALPELEAPDGVERLVAQFEQFGGDRPIIALGLAWLRANLPAPIDPVLIHGDFRTGNLLAEHGRLTGVLDWELAHTGDAHEDLAFGCMAVWRFGAIDKPAFGLADLDTFFAAYEAASGRAVDRDRFRFWSIYRTIWWALGCLHMGHYWREGTDRSLERVVVARRTTEQELDLLLLLDDGTAGRAATTPAAASPARSGEPGAEEILTAVSEWLAGTVKPKLEGHDRFTLAVAQNALGIVRRELAGRPEVHDRTLAQDILAGRQTAATAGLLDRLRRSAIATTAADVPKYPSLPEARARWEQER